MKIKSLVKCWLAAPPKLVYSYSKDKGSRIALFNIKDHPSYDEAHWKDTVQDEYSSENNCYSYALNNRDIKALNPGWVAYSKGLIDKKDLFFYWDDSMPFNDYCQKNIELAELDGLVHVKDEFSMQPGKHLIALAVRESKEYGRDYHWYRLDNDGYWSHKRGTDYPITKRDGKDSLITNPAHANRGLYKHFAGYFLVPNEGLSLDFEGRHEIKKLIRDYRYSNSL